MPVKLTPNAIAAINSGEVNFKPLVQVMDINLLGSAQERYKMLISDSVSTQNAMLATQLNVKVKTGLVKIGSVVQLIDYICSDVQNRRIVVVLNMETIVLESEIIGNPNCLNDMTVQKPLNNISSVQSGRVFYNNSSSQNNGGNLQSFQPALSAQNPVINLHGLRPTNFSQNQGTKVQGSRPLLNNARNGSNGMLRPTTGNNTQSYPPTVQPAYQPAPNYISRGPIMKNEAPARVIPIAALNPYQGRWAIKARVTAKGDLRRYNNARGDGKVFSFDLLDSDGGEIRVTCFNSVVDRFYDVIEVGRVYLIAKGNLKPAQKNFNHLKNEWEIFLEATSTVDLCQEEDGSIPQQQFAFKPISEIESSENNSILDIVGVVISVNPSVPIMRKNGMETQRRTVSMKDSSGRSVELTLWGDFCNKEGQVLQEMVDSGIYPVLAVKAGKVSDFTGKSVGTISSTQLLINPEIPEAQGLREWFDRGGQNSATVSISKDMVPAGSKKEIRKTVSQIKDEGLGRSEKPDWVTVKATITFFKIDSFCYTACPLMIGDRQCNKKVNRSGKSGWVCDRCNQEIDECDYRYLLQFQIQDHTGLAWVTAFQESGEEIMGFPAKELYEMKNKEQEESRLSELFGSRVFYRYLLRLKIKEEMYGDELRVKITVVKADKIDYSSESRHMLAEIVSGSHK
ncbi:Replication protein A 70 kDa DNA-binding subunit A [Linum perenne]